MIYDVVFWFTVGGLLATCFAAIGSKSLREFSRHELEEICRRHKARNRFGEILRLHERIALAVDNLVVLATTLLVVTGSYWAWREAWADAALPGPWSVLGHALVLGLILSATLIWIPWAVARLWAEPFLFRTWRLWRATGTLMTPLVRCSQLVDTLLHRLAGRTHETPSEESFEEEIRTIVTEGLREGLLEEDAREMIEGVIELGDADVSQIMTPRTDMHMIHVEISWEDMLDDVIKVGHTRVPVYDQNRDDIIGILFLKDLLPELSKDARQPRRSLDEIVRKPYFVPETNALDDLLRKFQQTRNHMAVVLDEYGGVSGLVTIEDVLEEIVGEIVDEHDADLIEEIQMIDDRTCEALGRTHVDEINEAMGLKLPEDGDFDTIGGFVFTQLGRIPLPDESLIWEDKVRITVLEASRRRIDRVLVERLGEEVRESA